MTRGGGRQKPQRHRCRPQRTARLVIAFLDASAVIDAVEGEAVWAEAVKWQLCQLPATGQACGGGLRLAVSRLSWLECRLGPLRRRDHAGRSGRTDGLPR
jgi:hypothetical protein